jgi:hypothetical protein
MDEKKSIAEALLDIALRGETEFFEVGSDYDLIEQAEKIGIKLPSPDLALFKTIYAEIDRVNRNGIILSKAAVEKGLETLKGKQINWEHLGRGHICGYIIDAGIKEDKIEITGVIFKSLFPEEMTEVKEKFSQKELAVSFEIWNKNPETGESVVRDLEDGSRAIDPIIFHGCGLLLANQPACPKAKVYKLIARAIQGAEQIVEKVFETDLIFAELAIEEPKCKNCDTCNCEKEENKVDLYELTVAEQSLEIIEEEIASFENEYIESTEIEEAKRLTYEERQKLSDDDFALVVTVKNKTTGEPRKIRMFVITDEAHVRNALTRLAQDAVKETLKKLGVSIEDVQNKILKRAKELNMTDLLERYNKSSEETKTEETSVETKTEEVAETKTEETKVDDTTEAQAEQQTLPVDVRVIETITEETMILVEIPEENGIKCTRRGLRRRTVKYSDGHQEVQEEEFEVIDRYTSAQLEEAIKKAKDEKDAEIATLKTEHEAVVVAKDEEIKNKNIELEQKTQEIAELTPKVEEKVELEMTVGAVETKSRYDSLQAEVNKKAFPKKK